MDSSRVILPKEGTKIYFGKPIIYDEGRSHFTYPIEARLRNMTYATTIHYDVEVEFIRTLRNNDDEPDIYHETQNIEDDVHQDGDGEFESDEDEEDASSE